MTVSIFLTNSASGILTKADLHRFLEMCDEDKLPGDLIVHGTIKSRFLGVEVKHRLIGLHVSSRDRVRGAGADFDEAARIRAELGLPVTATPGTVIEALRERHGVRKTSVQFVEQVAAASGSTTSKPAGLIEHVRTTRLAFRQLSDEAEDARTILGKSSATSTEEYLAALAALKVNNFTSADVVALAGMPEEASLADALDHIRAAVEAYSAPQE